MSAFGEFTRLGTWLEAQLLFPKKLSETRVHLAGQGGGLCATYEDLFMCRDEEYEMPRETIYYV
jgi:hypothetical protein